LGALARAGFCAGCLLEEAVTAVEADESESELAVEEPAAPRARQFGNYELLEEIGWGGMGIVFKARQAGIGRLVAVKLLRFGPLAGEEFVKRLRMEATAAGSIRHPNIVAIHEVGIYQDQHYLAMDYVPGPNLAKFINGQPLPARRAATLARAIANAIHHAHEHGVLHRDLKPSNILLDGAEEPHITDFGLAKRLESFVEGDSVGNLTVTGQVVGSPNYMPPEQASAAKGKISRASDVYSMGAILYELLTGRPPFLGENIAAILREVVETEPVAPRLLNPNVPLDLETICLKCLEKEPERRYATARELEEDVARFLSGDPIRARPINVAQRFWRWRQKHAAFANLIGLTLALLLVVAIGSPVAAYRIDRARKEAERAGQRAAKGETEARGQLYAATMNLAQAAHEGGNLQRLAELLEEGGHYAGRGFEWRFWERQQHLNMTQLRGHWGRLDAVAFSPDGRRLLSSGDDEAARIWDVETGVELFSLLGNKARTRGAAWFPDGRRVVTASDDHTVRIWDASTGGELAVLKSNYGRAYAVAVSPDGKWIASGHSDGAVTLWASSGEGEPRAFPAHRLRVSCLAFSPDSKWLAAGSYVDGKVFDVSSGRELATLEGSWGEIRAVAFSPDGKRIAAASSDSVAHLWDTASGRMIRALAGHEDALYGAAFFPGGERVVTGGADWTLRVWDANSGVEKALFSPHGEAVTCVAVSPDGKRIAAGAINGRLAIWPMERELRRPTLKALGAVWSLAFSEDGQTLFAGEDRGGLSIFDLASERMIRSVKVAEGEARSSAFGPHGRIFLAAGGNENGNFWTADGRKITPLRRPMQGFFSMAFSGDERRLAAGSAFGTIALIDVETGADIYQSNAHRSVISSLAFSADNRRIISGSWDRTARISDAATGRELIRTPHMGSVNCVAFSPDGTLALSGGQDRTVRLWDAATGVDKQVFRGHAGSVRTVAFSRDGRRVFTATENREAMLWDATNGALLLTFPRPRGTILTAAFSDDDRRIALGISDGSVEVWEASSEAEVAAWRSEEKAAIEKIDLARRAYASRLERERAARAREPGSLRNWLVLAPISLEGQYNGRAKSDRELLPDEARIHPSANERIVLGGVEKTWRPIQLEGTALDFAHEFGRADENVMAYLVCYVHAETARDDLRLLVGTDDYGKIYVSGRMVYGSDFERGFQEDEDVVEGVHLDAGTNVIVFKVFNVRADWAASLRITEKDGSPARGIKADITP